MSQQYVITELHIAGLVARLCVPHPEQTPVGPFDSREEAWNYAQRVMTQFGNGGGSVDVAPLHPPLDLREGDDD